MYMKITASALIAIPLTMRCDQSKSHQIETSQFVVKKQFPTQSAAIVASCDEASRIVNERRLVCDIKV